MTPSDFNDDLFDELGDLIAESMEELGRRKLITIGFLRNIMLKAFEDEEENLDRRVNTVYTGMLQAVGSDVPQNSRDIESAVSYNLSATGGQTQIVVPLFLDGREIARATAWSMGQQLAWEEM